MKIVFIVYSPVTLNEEKTFQIKYLRSQGFEVEIFDLTLLFNPAILVENISRNILIGDYVKNISSYEELECLLEKYAVSAIFVDCIVGPNMITLKVEKLFRLLKIYKVQYIVFSAGGIPFANRTFNGLLLLNRLRKALNIYKLLDFIFPKIAVFLARKGRIYPVPAMLFGTCSDAFKECISSYCMDINKLVKTHSFDYDRFLYYQRSLNGHKILPDNTCVFLDEALTHHLDYTIVGGMPFDPVPYSLSMNKFFDWIEKSTGLRVIIAAHPKSRYDEMADMFNGRSIIKGKTIELVSKSSLVVVHASTSVNFAVLYNKPILFAKTKLMQERFDFNRRIDSWAQSLGVNPVNIDTDKLDYGLISEPLNSEKYMNYLHKYIKTKGVADKTFWEIFSSEIKKRYVFINKTQNNFCS